MEQKPEPSKSVAPAKAPLAEKKDSAAPKPGEYTQAGEAKGKRSSKMQDEERGKH